MAVNEVILELAKQLSVLQAKYDDLVHKTQAFSQQKTFGKNALNKPPVLNAWMQHLAKEKEQELLTKFADRIASIKKKDPGWNPPKEFFDI